VRVTVHDIARAANVSRGTVHRALYNRSGVSEDTRQRVLLIARHLDYKPYLPAKVLATQRKLLIPIVVPVDENEDPLWYQVKAGTHAIAHEIREVGMETQWVVPRSWDATSQIAVMEELIARRVDGIALAPVDPDTLSKIIDKAVDSGIPVITFNTDAPESQRMCFVGQDSLTAGRVAGALMGEFLNREGKVAIITGFHRTLGHRQRLQGFKEQMQKYFPHIEIIGIYENHDKPKEAYNISQKALKSCSDLGGIYVTAGGPFGAGYAVKDAGKGGIIKLICFDLLKETIQLIREGIVQASIQQDPFFQGYEPVRILHNYLLTNRKPPEEFVFTNFNIACQGNIEILARKHFKNADTVTGQVFEKLSFMRRARRS
jgi:LacI family transcriptional regulator